MSSPTPGDTNSYTPPAIPEELRCKYSQKICTRERAFKVSGDGRHQLCAYHRDNANTYQQRHAEKNREERRRKLQLAQKYPLDEGIEVPNDMDTTDFPTDPTSLVEITDDDVLQLENVLGSDEEYELLRAAVHQPDN